MATNQQQDFTNYGSQLIDSLSNYAEPVEQVIVPMLDPTEKIEVVVGPIT